MEPKRACCGPNIPPISPLTGNQRQTSRYQSPGRDQTENCGSRRCRYAKSQIQNDPYSTQKLLEKIQYMKKTIQDLEATQQQLKNRNVEKKDAPCQTPEITPSDIYNIRDIVNSCIAEMTKLKDFLDDENCWWKIFKKRDFNCCEQKLPHLHGFLDGTMVTLKMLEETLQPGKDFVTSTPLRTPTFPPRHKPAEQADEQQVTKLPEPIVDQRRDDTRRFVDAATNTRRSIDFTGVNFDSSSPQRCHTSCVVHGPQSTAASSWNGTEDESTSYRPFQPSELRRGPRDQPQTFYSLADGSEPNETWLSKRSLDLGESQAQQQGPPFTFSSENMARRSVLAQDMSTSMDAIPPAVMDSITNLTGVTERSFSMNPSRSSPRDRATRVKKQAQQK